MLIKKKILGLLLFCSFTTANFSCSKSDEVVTKPVEPSIPVDSTSKDTVSLPKQSERPNWSLDSTQNFAYSMTAVVKLQLDSMYHFDSSDLVGAFINGQCRGLGTFKFYNQSPTIFMFVHGNSDEESPVELRYYNQNKKILFVKDTAFIFTMDTNVGTIDSPTIITVTPMYP